MKLCEVAKMGWHDYTEIKQWLYDMNIAHDTYIINENGVINVDGNVDIEGRDLTSIPVQFGHVAGYFDCSSNKLTSLKGCPHTVGKYFACNDNTQLTSLQYCPLKTGSDFICEENPQLFDILRFVFDPNFKLGKTFFTSRYNTSPGNLSHKLSMIITNNIHHGDLLTCVDQLLDAGFEQFCAGLNIKGLNK